MFLPPFWEYGDVLKKILSNCQNLANSRKKDFHGDVPLLQGILETTSKDLNIAVGGFREKGEEARKTVNLNMFSVSVCFDDFCIFCSVYGHWLLNNTSI